MRYLEKAFSTTSPTQAWGQLKLVFEALHERKRLLENAPHLCSALPIMTVSARASSAGTGSGAAESDGALFASADTYKVLVVNLVASPGGCCSTFSAEQI